MSSNSTPELHAILGEIIANYVQQNPQSKAIHEEAVKSLPGGNTRTVLHADPWPLCMKSGKGYQVTSEDGRTYTDLTGEFTAALYGHSNPVILSTIQDVIQNVGMNVSATTSQERLFAKEICQRFQLDQVRLTNSGTEGNLQALAAARLFTKKRKIVTFGSGYHGSVLGFAGGKPGVNNVDIDDWIVATYNDLNSATVAIQSEGVAAVLMEGMQGAGGCICGTPKFLTGVQKVASEAGVIFILDEVMTSRLSGGGFSELRGLKPDLKTFGKYLGGGLAFGAFGGRADIMAAFDPRLSGAVAHSGTFNNNTLVTHTGYAGMTQIYTPKVAEAFTKTGNQLIFALNRVCDGTKLSFTGFGSVMTAHFTEQGSHVIENAQDVTEIQDLKDIFWFEMLDQGFWLARRGFIGLILETPQSELDRFVGAVEGFVSKYKGLVSLSK